jgi:hypothetical protein
MSDQTCRRKRPSMPDFETRERQAKRRLSSEHPTCCLCGHSDWRALQLHHVASRACDEMTVIVCANCHAALSDAQHDHPPNGQDPPSPFEHAGRWLVNLADFLRYLASKLQELGQFLLGSPRPKTIQTETAS